MIIELFHNKIKSIYGFVLIAETPLGANEKETILYEEITEAKYEYYLKRFKDESCYNAKLIKNKVDGVKYQIKEKSIYR